MLHIKPVKWINYPYSNLRQTYPPVHWITFPVLNTLLKGRDFVLLTDHHNYPTQSHCNR